MLKVYLETINRFLPGRRVAMLVDLFETANARRGHMPDGLILTGKRGAA